VPDAITLHAHAKLNLALAVGPPVPGGPAAGMHPVASWMTAIDLADTVAVRRLNTGDPSRHTVRWHDGRPVDWATGDDLAVRAHRALETEKGPLPAEIEVTKRIPAGGGLGGGSSDAAAFLRALNHLFDLDTPPDDLARLAAALGSDIPFFIDRLDDPHAAPRPAFVTGLGERIERLPPIDPASHEILLISPPFGCPTGAVYRAFDDDPPDTFREHAVDDLARSGTIDPESLFNDLAAPAERVEPRLARLRRDLAKTLGLPVHVSGSGSTLFVIVPGPGAEGVRADLAARCPDSIVQPVRPAYLAGQQSG